MKKFIVFAVVMISGYLFACDKCHGNGYYTTNSICPLCAGETNVSPAWFNKRVSVERWTETTYLLSGVTKESNRRTKHNNFLACPCCRNSKFRTKGEIATIWPCDCGATYPANLINQATFKLKSLIRNCNAKDINLDEVGDADKIRVAYESKNWQASGKTLAKLLKEALEDDYDEEGADYNRENAKVRKNKLIGQ